MHKNIKKCTLFDNFIGCSFCGRNCNDDSLALSCRLCSKWFHRKCKKLTIKQYLDALMKKSFCCSDKCHISYLPFHNSNDIELASSIWGDGSHLCKFCNNDCLDETDYLTCIVCESFFHKTCLQESPSKNFVCSNKCYQQMLPFSKMKNS